jgi:hypothetical protein
MGSHLGLLQSHSLLGLVILLHGLVLPATGRHLSLHQGVTGWGGFPQGSWWLGHHIWGGLGGCQHLNIVNHSWM